MDLLLIDVARNAYYKAGTYEQKPLWTEDSSISHFQLASFKTLLASFLSNPHERPLYLEQGLELFHQGNIFYLIFSLFVFTYFKHILDLYCFLSYLFKLAVMLLDKNHD